MRIACLYALLAASPVIKGEHLKAAIALWQYAEDSVHFIFGQMTGNSIADSILQALSNQPDGLTRTQIRDMFGRNRSSGHIDRALAILLQNGLARRVSEQTAGRPAERWFAIGGATT